MYIVCLHYCFACSDTYIEIRLPIIIEIIVEILKVLRKTLYFLNIPERLNFFSCYYDRTIALLELVFMSNMAAQYCKKYTTLFYCELQRIMKTISPDTAKNAFLTF